MLGSEVPQNQTILGVGAPAKGADAFGVAWLGGVLEESSFTKLMLKSDGEPAIISLKQKVKEAKPHLQVHLVETPVDDRKANGFIEVGVREMKRCCALISDFQHRLGKEVDPSHPMMVWIPRHAAFLLTRFRIGKWRIPLVRFGERILYRPRANRGGKRDDIAP